jgi:uncharacterized phiE125 gp8 family phage protein
MPYILLTPPAVEPVSLNEAKAHLRVDITDDDTLIGALISAARTHAEMVTQRQFVTATWKLVLDAFPGPSLMGVPSGMPFSMPAHAVQLNKSPVQSVISVKYLDMGGTMQTMPPADYKVDISTEPARITPVFGKIWPVTLPQIGSVEITFTSGYGTLDNSTPPVWVPQQVPEGIKAWMKIRMATLYENREEIALMSRGKLEPLPYVDGLLDPFRIVSY